MKLITEPGKKCSNLKEGWYCIGLTETLLRPKG